MSSKKRPSNAADAYYIPHLYGRGFKNNPTTTRVAMLERMYIRILTELAANRFEWKGLPDTVDVRFLELTLFNKGLAVFYDDADFGQLALGGSAGMQLNPYGDPLAFRVFSSNGRISKTISSKECVPIWSNYLRVPDLDIVYIYAGKLAELDRTVEINSKNARRSKVVFVPENKMLSYANIMQQIDNGEAAIKVTTSFDVDTIQAFDLGVEPDSIEKLHILRTRLFNECMGLMGINNANQDKKERLVEAEVGANDDQISATRAVNLNARKTAADKISAMFNLNVTVDFYKPPVEALAPSDDDESGDSE